MHLSIPFGLLQNHDDQHSYFAGPGTRPGLHGLTLVSTGQAELDRLLGGGLPLGTVMVILEDAFTQHHVTFLKSVLSCSHHKIDTISLVGAMSKYCIHQNRGYFHGPQKNLAVSSEFFY